LGLDKESKNTASDEDSSKAVSDVTDGEKKGLRQSLKVIEREEEEEEEEEGRRRRRIQRTSFKFLPFFPFSLSPLRTGQILWFA
jgi:hypothetical protein